MFVEIRNYHYDPDKFEAYRNWAVDEAVPFLKANLDLVGFWLDNGEKPEIDGRDPMSLKHGFRVKAGRTSGQDIRIPQVTFNSKQNLQIRSDDAVTRHTNY